MCVCVLSTHNQKLIVYMKTSDRKIGVFIQMIAYTARGYAKTTRPPIVSILNVDFFLFFVPIKEKSSKTKKKEKKVRRGNGNDFTPENWLLFEFQFTYKIISNTRLYFLLQPIAVCGLSLCMMAI